MKRIVSIAAAAAFSLLTLPSVAAPQLPNKPRWEYAELNYRPARTILRGDDTEPPATTPASIRWTTGEGEMETKGWAELAEKLKAPSLKKDASPTLQKIQLLNHLGSEGWELVSQVGGASPAALDRGPGGGAGRTTPASLGIGTWTFKRRVR